MSRRKKTSARRPEENGLPRIALVSLGCAKNTIDSETALGELLGAGYSLAIAPEDADLILINTCGFIAPARQESLGVIEEMLALKTRQGSPKVVAMGCLSERMGQELAEQLPELDGIFGLAAYGNLKRLCEEVMHGGGPVCNFSQAAPMAIPEGPRLLVTPPSYAYLRIAEGCSNRCAYCAIPDIRGSLRSRPADHVVEEARTLVETMGVQELILVAQDTTGYGLERREGSQLAGLLDRLLKETQAPRIRLLYAHPAHLEDEVIHRLASEPRLCGYLDLPLQHVNSDVLRRMNRPYDREGIDQLLARLRKAAPSLVLRTTLIVGFPGEEETAFQDLVEFAASGSVQHLGIFAYSPEPGTPAAGFSDQVSEEEKEERVEHLMRVKEKTAHAWLDSLLSTEVEVLVDRQTGPGTWEGRIPPQAPDVDGITQLTGEDFYVGGIFRACLTSRTGYDIIAEPSAPIDTEGG